MNNVETLTIDFGNESATRRTHHEFDSDEDGEMLANALIETYGSKEAALEEMMYMTIVAACRDDRTTINGLAAARKYWRQQVVSPEQEKP